MDKKPKLPKEGVVKRGDDVARGEDGTDVEGHRLVRMPDPEPFLPRLPSTGGELTDDDVEGHGAP